MQRKASGNLEFNLRSESIGYLLKSLFGKCDSTPVAGSASAVDHKFTIEKLDPQYPSLSIALATGAEQHYGYNNALVKSLEIKTPVDDLVNAVVDFIASDESEQADFTPVFGADDLYFRPQDVSIKIATDVSGLAAAIALNIKEMSVKHDNGAKAQQHIGSITPTDNLAGIADIGGSITLNYEGKAYHDVYKNGDYKAMQITIVRSDIDLDVENNHPTITIVLPKISIEKYSPDRKLDDIVRDKLDFIAHYDEDADEAIEITVRNNVAEYVADEESGS